MRVALAIVDLFGWGGLQRDCIGIARRLIQRGHDVTILCRTQDGDFGIPVKRFPNLHLLNHDRNARFAQDFSRIADEFDLIVGFNKLPHLDMLYCADPPKGQARTRIQKLNPRLTRYRALETACFGPDSRTHLILLAKWQLKQYVDIYNVDTGRVSIIPPTIERARVLTGNERDRARQALRREFGLTDSDFTLLFIGGYPQAKGLDRIIEALRDIPNIKCFCVGFDWSKQRKLASLARQAGVTDRLIQLGRRNDVPELMAFADLLVHPSRKDVTGTVILEALVNGLPVVATEVCGYAEHIARSGAGRMLSEPFDHAEFRQALLDALEPAAIKTWRNNAVDYVQREDLFSGLDVVADIIETAGHRTRGESHGLPLPDGA